MLAEGKVVAFLICNLDQLSEKIYDRPKVAFNRKPGGSFMGFILDTNEKISQLQLKDWYEEWGVAGKNPCVDLCVEISPK